MKNTLLISVLVLFSINTQAGIFGQNEGTAVHIEKQRPMEMDRENTAGLNNKTRTSQQTDSILKCWQYGRLLFEENNWRKGQFGSSNGKMFNGITEYGKTFSIVNMGDTVCYIRE